MTKSTQRPIRVGDKVVPDASTHDRGTIRLGDNTPTFRTSGKVVSDTETADQSKVRLGDFASVFSPKK
jgi:hypothetical protein